MPSNKSLLIVDDSRVSRMMIKSYILSKQPEWNLFEAESGEQALEIAIEKTIDFFSVDLNMPGINGLELIEKLIPIYPTARYALLTANIQEATRIKSGKLGAAHINKPVTEQSIITMLDYFND